MQSGGTKGLTARYAAVQASFWMSFCTAVSFAAVYLQGVGYSNAALGAVMAAGSLLGALLGPALSAWIDGNARVSAGRLMPPVLACQAAMLLLLALFPQKGLAASVGYALYIAVANSVNSLNLKLYADAAHQGMPIDYAFARGMGSGAYVLLSLLLGWLVERASIRAILYAGLVLCALQWAAFLWFSRAVPETARRGAGGGETGAPLAVFAAENPRFCLMLLGTALLFFSHNTVTNYLINVVRGVGGDTGTMGLLNAFMAAVEIPVMLLFSRVLGGKNSAALLRAAFVFFALKSAAIAAAGSIPLLFAAFVLQAPSFALYTSAVVPYVGRTVAHKDSAKAQSLAFTMTTVGSVLSGVVGGRLYDALPVAAVLWIACAVSAVGAAVSFFGVKR